MATPTTRKIQLGSLILGVSGACMLFTFLPFKRYHSVSLFFGGGSEGSDSIFSLLHDMIASSFDPVAIVAALPFLAIFSPLVILAELGSSNGRVRGRLFFLFQGIMLLGSGLWMLLIMNLDVMETDVKLLPTFYIVLCWVMVPVVFSFTLISRQVQNSLRRFIS